MSRRTGARGGAAAMAAPSRAGGTVLALAMVALALTAAPARADYVRDYEWQLAALHMTDAWAVTEGAGVTVAIIETGLVDASHPDLEGSVIAGTDLTGVGALDDHATGMAGTIAAHGRGGDGIIGIAPAATILPVTTNDTATMAAGFRWATDNGADIINCSCSLGLGDAPEVREAVAYALEHDIVVVAGAGNSSGGPVEVPGQYPGLLGVSALAKTMDTLTPISSYGPEVDIAAPAESLPGPKAGGGYVVGNGGTSAAAAVVSGVAALVRAAHPEMDAANVVNRIVSTATDIGTPGVDDQFGYGAVNPVAALTADIPAVTKNPLGNAGGDGKPPAVEPSTAPADTAPPAVEPVAPTDSAPSAADCTSPAAVEPADPAAGAAAPAGPAADSAAPDAASTGGPDCAAGTDSSSAAADSGSSPVGPILGVGAVILIALGLGGWALARRRSRTAAQTRPPSGPAGPGQPLVHPTA